MTNDEFKAAYEALRLTKEERRELEAYREKARRECDAYYQQMRGMMNFQPPMTIAEMQQAMNVNLHARDLSDIPPAYIEVPASPYETSGHEFTKLILRQAMYFLFLMLAIGVGLAVFL